MTMATKNYRPQPGDRAFGPCTREGCPHANKVVWQKKWVLEVMHACPVKGKVGTTEQRPLKPGALYGKEET